MINIAVLLTCFNRKEKTLACLDAFYKCTIPEDFLFDIFLVDDGSKDGTAQAVKSAFPDVNVTIGSGNLFWAGGMRLVWQTAMQTKFFEGYLLLNDDVVLNSNTLTKLAETHHFSMAKYNKQGLYVGSTAEKTDGKASYGGSRIHNTFFKHTIIPVSPNSFPQECQISNANILMIMKPVVDSIGIFDKKFTHGIADYDYTLTATEKGFPLLVLPGVNGYCIDDHGKNWLPTTSPLKKRLEFLYSPKGLAYKEYLYFIKKHFPSHLPYYFSMLWLKTLFPVIWDKLK